MAQIETFVAVGANLDSDASNNIGYSPDGENWTVVTNTDGLFQGGFGLMIASDGSGTFVAAGYSADDLNNIGYSTNSGLTWSVATETNGLFNGGGGNYGAILFGFGGIAYGYTPDGSGVFVAVGYSADDASNIGYSQDGGDTWTVVAPADNNGLFQGEIGGGDIAYGLNQNGSGVFVAVGTSLDDASNIGYSSDGGQTWTVVAPAQRNGLFFSGSGGLSGGIGIAYGYTSDGSGIFVAVGAGGDASNIGYSTTGGQTWQVATNTGGLFESETGVGFGSGVTFGYDETGNGVFVAVGGLISGGDNGVARIGYSSDGDSWNVVPDADLNGLFGGGGGAYTSVSYLGLGITYGNIDGSGVFVVVGASADGSNNNVGYSTDGGRTWTIANKNGLFDEGFPLGLDVAFSNTLAPIPPPPIPPIYNICFPAGTPIKTDQGIIPIEKLHSNNNKYTINKQPIQHITKTVTQDTYLICFEKNALGPNIPSEKTIMTKDHKLMFEGRYVAAEKFLSLSKKVTKVKYNGELLYNVLLETYGTLQVNNLVCETLHPDNLIAKLYNNYKEAERPDLVCQLNASLLERNVKKYKAVERKILHK